MCYVYHMDEQFRSVVEDVLGVDGAALQDDDSSRSIPQWDSVAHLQLLLALESAFGVQFTPEDMATLNTIGRIRERLKAMTVDG